MLLLPDHATPISIKTHSCDPVPFAIMGDGIEPDGVRGLMRTSAKRGGYGLGGGDGAGGNDGKRVADARQSSCQPLRWLH